MLVTCPGRRASHTSISWLLLILDLQCGSRYCRVTRHVWWTRSGGRLSSKGSRLNLRNCEPWNGFMWDKWSIVFLWSVWNWSIGLITQIPTCKPSLNKIASESFLGRTTVTPQPMADYTSEVTTVVQKHMIVY